MKYDDLKAQLELVASTYSSDLEASVLDELLQFKDILSTESDKYLYFGELQRCFFDYCLSKH